MLNHSADYALRAVLFLAQRDGTDPCSATVIAKALGVPRNYLGKVLHVLARTRVVGSMRGPHGGFHLGVPADVLTLAEVVEPFQRFPARQKCLLVDKACDAMNPCAPHLEWEAMMGLTTDFFQMTTIASMLRHSAGDGEREPTPRRCENMPPVHDPDNGGSHGYAA